jgi:hypothetical protein
MAWLVLAGRVPTPTSMDRRTGDVQTVYAAAEFRKTRCDRRIARIVCSAR